MDSHFRLVRRFRWGALPLIVLAIALPACAGRGEGTLAPPTEPTAQSEEPTSDPGKPPALVDLEGLWPDDGGDTLLRFRLDGTYEVGEGIPDFPANHLGTFQLEGSKITFVIRETPRSTRAMCGPGGKWVWEEVELLGAGRLKALITRDDCGRPPSYVDVEVTWTRVSA